MKLTVFSTLIVCVFCASCCTKQCETRAVSAVPQTTIANEFPDSWKGWNYDLEVPADSVPAAVIGNCQVDFHQMYPTKCLMEYRVLKSESDEHIRYLYFTVSPGSDVRMIYKYDTSQQVVVSKFFNHM